MVFSSDTRRGPDQTTQRRRSGRVVWALLVLLCSSGPEIAHAQVLCPAAIYAEDALTAELGASLEVRRGNGRAIWAHESACGRLELGKHWASLRATHAFGQGQPGPATGPISRAKIVNAVRALSEYRYLLKHLGDSGALRVEGLIQYERDQVRRIAQRVQWGLGPSLGVVDTEVVRLTFTPAYVFELQRDWVPGPRPWVEQQLAWLSGELGWDIDGTMFLGQEVIAQLPLERCPCEPRVYAQTNFRVRGNEWLSLESALLFMFDRAQSDLGLSRWDVVLRTGLVFTL